MCLKAHLNVLGKTEIYKSFSVPMKREVIKIDRNNKKAMKLCPTK